MELPAADGGVEARARRSRPATPSVLKPAETTPLTALLLAEVIQEAELPPGVVNIVTGAGETGAALVDAPTSTRSRSPARPRSARRSGARSPARGKRLTLELGGKAANIVFEDAPLDQAVEGVVNGIFFNQGHVCCAGSRLLVQEPVFEPLLEKLKDRLQTLRVGDPLDKNTDVGAINSRAQLEKIEELVASRRRRGRRDLPARLRAARARVLVPAHAVHRRVAVAPHRARGDLRAGAVDPHVPHAGGGRREGEQHARTACRRACGPRRARGSCGWPQRLRAGVVWANTFNRFDPTSPFGGYKESGFGREGGLHGLEPYLDARRRRAMSDDAPARASARPSCSSAARSRGSESGRSYEVVAHDGRPLAHVGAGLAQGPARRGAWPRAAAQPGGRRMTAYNRGQVLYRVAELMEGRRAQFVAELADAGRVRPGARRERRDRPMGLVRGLGRQDRPGAGRLEPRGRARTSTSRSRSRPAWWGSSRRRSQSLLGLVSRLAPAIVSGNTAVVLASESAPLPAVSLAEVLATSDVPGGVVNILTGVTAELVPWLAGHMDVNAIDVTGRAGGSAGRGRGARRREREARAPRSRRRPVRRRGAEPVRDHGAHGVQDRLAPDGRLSAPVSSCRCTGRAGLRDPCAASRSTRRCRSTGRSSSPGSRSAGRRSRVRPRPCRGPEDRSAPCRRSPWPSCRLSLGLQRTAWGSGRARASAAA